MLVLLALAGCASDEKEAIDADDGTPPVGVLAGVVLDPAINPLPGAEVRVGGDERVNITDEDGRFAFPDMEPGTYTVTASLDGYLETQVVASISETTTPVVKVVLPVDSEALAYFTPYHFQGFVECAAFPFNWCAQVNIASIILCEGYGTCLGNVTTDRSLALHWLDGVPDFLQTEMVWEASNSLGENFLFVIGGGTREELAGGFVSALNTTRGPSPLMLQLDNETLAEHSIGGERALMTQLHPSPQEEIPGGCVQWNPCGPSFHLMQDYEYFTHTFFGYRPPSDWRFADGDNPPGP